MSRKISAGVLCRGFGCVGSETCWQESDIYPYTTRKIDVREMRRRTETGRARTAKRRWIFHSSREKESFVRRSIRPYVVLMDTKTYDPRRIEEIARRAGMERSLYMGEAIGNALAIAWHALGALGGWLRRAVPRIRRLS